MAEYILPLERLIEQFQKLPGIGKKSAVRLAFEVLDFTPEEAEAFAEAVKGVIPEEMIDPYLRKFPIKL